MRVFSEHPAQKAAMHQSPARKTRQVSCVIGMTKREEESVEPQPSERKSGESRLIGVFVSQFTVNKASAIFTSLRCPALISKQGYQYHYLPVCACPLFSTPMDPQPTPPPPPKRSTWRGVAIAGTCTAAMLVNVCSITCSCGYSG